jgi:hypothetical protein
MQRYRSETCTFAAYMHTIELIDKSRYLISQNIILGRKNIEKYKG